MFFFFQSADEKKERTERVRVGERVCASEGE